MKMRKTEQDNKSLEETQQGKLKGGFSTMSAATLFGYSPDNNCYNNCDRGCKTKD